MNYRYKIRGENIVLSQDEHNWVKQQTKDDAEANVKIRLRGGDLIFDTAMIDLVVPTEQLTDVQEEKKVKRPQLPEMSQRTEREKREKVGQFLKADHDAFYAKMGWDHKADCICKKDKGDQK